jgi:hypothetical protein
MVGGQELLRETCELRRIERQRFHLMLAAKGERTDDGFIGHGGPSS